MANITVKKGLIGQEDINLGTGTFSRAKSDGSVQTITKVNAEQLITLPAGTRTVSTVTDYLANGAVHNVKDYGATGDGTTDDATAIQAAIDACPQDGVLYLPGGSTYTIGTKLDIGQPLSLLADGAILKAKTGMSGPMLKLHYDLGVGAQRVGCTKQTGYYRGLILDGNDIAQGMEFSRVYRAHFENMWVINTLGTAWFQDRCVECTFTNCTIQFCLRNNSEPLIDWTWEDPSSAQASGGDNNNSCLYQGCSWVANSHETYLKYNSSATVAAKSLRNNSFHRCLIHHLNDSYETEFPTRWAAQPYTDVVLVDIGHVSHAIFSDCEFQMGDATGTCVKLGDTAAADQASAVQFVNCKFDEQSGAPGVVFDVQSVSEGTGTWGCQIDVNFTLTDAARALLWQTSGPLELDFTNFYDSAVAPVGLRMTNNSATSVTSERSPILQFRNPNNNVMNVMLQEAGTTPQGIVEVSDKTSGTKVWAFDADGAASTFYMGGSEHLNLGKNASGVRSLSLATLTAEPTDKHEGMIVLADGSSWDPLTVGTPHTVLWDGSAWRAL